MTPLQQFLSVCAVVSGELAIACAVADRTTGLAVFTVVAVAALGYVAAVEPKRQAREPKRRMKS